MKRGLSELSALFIVAFFDGRNVWLSGSRDILVPFALVYLVLSFIDRSPKRSTMPKSLNKHKNVVFLSSQCLPLFTRQARRQSSPACPWPASRRRHQ